MNPKSGKLVAAEPSNVFTRPLTVDIRAIFKAVGKGVAHTALGKWSDVAADTVEALASLGLATKPDELAFLLIRRALISALFSLFEDSIGPTLSDLNDDAERLVKKVSAQSFETRIDQSFLDRPGEIELIKQVADNLQTWLAGCGFSTSARENISSRLPSYFTYAINNEWRKNSKSYQPLKDSLATPFSVASEREWAWAEYCALLQKRAEESVFDESFSLTQIYVPLNAYFTEESKGRGPNSDSSVSRKRQRRHVVSLNDELQNWISTANPQDTIRVISGGPGSGKSSFAKIFSARLSRERGLKVLFVPLHLIDAHKDLIPEVGRFVKDEGVLLQNPLEGEVEPNLLIIFDGLDELASQGKAAAETARAFVREVERVTHRINLARVRVRILLSGREVVVQENESEFRGRRQVLTVLPYYVSTGKGRLQNLYHYDDNEYVDPEKLLTIDLRQAWWKKYGSLTGKPYDGLPKEIDRPDLAEITSQPLLNFLVALSYTRERVDFARNINLNSVYGDLVAAVHERGYEKHRAYGPIRHMKVGDFSRVLEEVGLAAWHGDGRTTTVKEIEEHCKSSGLGVLLSLFQEGAQAGVTRLLAAFFFRQHGQRVTGEPTFVFTHKSFGEYLTSLRIARAVERVSREVASRADNPDMGWDERDALRHWAQITGPSAMSPYLHTFLLNEMALRSRHVLLVWQDILTKLLSHVLKHGMPMEQIKVATFKESMFQSRNSEEALLVALNSCAVVTRKTFRVEQPDRTSIGAWIRRVQGQRVGPEPALVAKCLSYIDIRGACLDVSDFYGANLKHANLQGIEAHYANFGTADMSHVNLTGAELSWSVFERTKLRNSKLSRARFVGVNLEDAYLRGSVVRGTDFSEANLTDTDFTDVDRAEAKFESRPKTSRVRKELRVLEEDESPEISVSDEGDDEPILDSTDEDLH